MKRQPRYLGVDLHRNCFTVYTRQANGTGAQRTWRSTELGAFAVTVRATDAMAVEATGNTRGSVQPSSPAAASWWGSTPTSSK